MTARAVLGIVIVWTMACRADRGHRWGWQYRVRLAWWRGPIEQWRVQRSAVQSMVLAFTVTALVVGGNLHAFWYPLVLS